MLPLVWPLGHSEGEAFLCESAFSLRESTKFYGSISTRWEQAGRYRINFTACVTNPPIFCAIGKLRNSYVVFIVEEFFAFSAGIALFYYDMLNIENLNVKS